MATITLQSPDGSTETFECDSDTFILEHLKINFFTSSDSDVSELKNL